MTITKKNDNTTLTVEIEGRLDTVTAPELDDELKAAVDDARALVLDLSKLVYISSAGLRILLSYHKKMSSKDGMKLVGVNDVVMEIFEITGFSDILTIEQ